MNSKKPFYKNMWFIIVGIICVISFWFLAIPLLLIAGGIILWANAYFKSEKFLSTKKSIQEYVEECNELNAHINDLRSTFAEIKKTDYGEATFQNISQHNYKKSGIQNAKYAPNIFDCSKQVCDGARKQPFKYICKYFNVKTDEETLENFENVMNNFLAAEEGKEASKNKRDKILQSIANDVPALVRKVFSKRLDKELGFDEFVFDELYFPVYSFRYISSGGKSGSQFDVVMDIPMLERFINFIAESVKFKKSAEGQRRLMTPKLRKSIIERDNYTCKECSNSTTNEPNLLLEVDHIIPIAKGGITTEENLQTLCWKCNRHKGAKIK